MKIRKSILAGQILLFGLGIFLLIVSYAIWDIMQGGGWWYTGPAPGLFTIFGIICLAAGLLLFSVLRYEDKGS